MGNIVRRVLYYFWPYKSRPSFKLIFDYYLGVDSDEENEQAITDSEDEVDYQNVVDKDESLINQLITKGCMKGGVDHEDDDEYEDPLDPASTVDFNMQGLKSKSSRSPE